MASELLRLVLAWAFLASLRVPRTTAAAAFRFPGFLRRYELTLPHSMSRFAKERTMNEYMQGIKRSRRLYCNIGIGFHLQILPNGRVNGVHRESSYSLLEISTVDRGVVSISGVRSGLYLAMSARGRAYSTPYFNHECKFKEELLPNHYNAYESLQHAGFYLSLNRKGRVRNARKVNPTMRVTHFLPRM
uniref:Fibroblast growth factor n=1 Tax=Eptatretus burgeri TaxID=7764 RepID=A0A8C4NAZ2_EPTBU